jgi:hypothetical protein
MQRYVLLINGSQVSATKLAYLIKGEGKESIGRLSKSSQSFFLVAQIMPW